jgi:hypothetical protein
MEFVHIAGYGYPITSSVGSFVANFPEMLGAMVVDSRRLIIICEKGYPS